MINVTQDQLWKAILEDLFEDFLRWFYQPFLDRIDLTRGFEFLDQELPNIYPESTSPNRYVDKLAKVWLKDGSEQWFILHIEVQAYRDRHFAERMYVYQYRIRDRYHKPVTAIAILADPHPRYHPREYGYSFMGTSVHFTFQTCKILDQDITTLESSDNPFALVLATVWHGLQRQTRNDEDRLIFKTHLVKNLLDRGFPRQRIRKLLHFIKYYTKFDHSDLYDTFELIIHPSRTKMGILELLEEEAKKQGLQQGLQ
ncbi:MAG: hypothetical protein EP344_07240, partial [Bacteroidetes bacterium]